MPLRKCYFPTLAVYNLNFMGLSSKQRRNARLSMVRHLMESHQIVGLEELHADTKRDANMFFFEHIHATKFYDSTVNMAILVNTEWAKPTTPITSTLFPAQRTASNGTREQAAVSSFISTWMQLQLPA